MFCIKNLIGTVATKNISKKPIFSFYAFMRVWSIKVLHCVNVFTCKNKQDACKQTRFQCLYRL